MHLHIYMQIPAHRSRACMNFKKIFSFPRRGIDFFISRAKRTRGRRVWIFRLGRISFSRDTYYKIDRVQLRDVRDFCERTCELLRARVRAISRAVESPARFTFTVLLHSFMPAKRRMRVNRTKTRARTMKSACFFSITIRRRYAPVSYSISAEKPADGYT